MKQKIIKSIKNLFYPNENLIKGLFKISIVCLLLFALCILIGDLSAAYAFMILAVITIALLLFVIFLSSEFYIKFKNNIIEVLLFLLGMILGGMILSTYGVMSLFYSNDYFIYKGEVSYTEKYDCDYEIDRYYQEHEVGGCSYNEVTKYLDEEIKDRMWTYGWIGALSLGLVIGGIFLQMRRKYNERINIG